MPEIDLLFVISYLRRGLLLAEVELEEEHADPDPEFFSDLLKLKSKVSVLLGTLSSPLTVKE